MKPYSLYSVETFHQRHICQVAARSNAECRRKAWKTIFKRSPRLVSYFRVNPFICIHEGDSGWGDADLGV